MATVTERDAAAMLDIVAEGATATGTEGFPSIVLTRLARLIPSDALAGYQEVDVSQPGCRLVARVEITGHEDPPSVIEASHLFCRQNPMRDPIRAREQRVLRLSDFYGKRELARLDFYREVWRPVGVDDCLRLWLPAPPGRAYVLFLERGGRAYGDRDRTLLELLRPHLIRMRLNAELRRRANGGSGLTEREHEVLGWIERGKTNAEVAAILHVSPHTVRKHVENIFDKLGVSTRTAAVARVRDGA